MCNPIALVAASVAVQGAGAIQGAMAANAAGKAQQAQYNYIAETNRIQAEEAIKVGERRDKASQDLGALEAAKLGRSVRGVIGAQKSALAKQGVGGVTAADILTDTLDKKSLDEMAIRYNADIRSWEAKTGAAYQSWDLNNQSTFNKIAGQNARAAGKAQATASLFSGASSILGTLGTYSLYNQNLAKVK